MRTRKRAFLLRDVEPIREQNDFLSTELEAT